MRAPAGEGCRICVLAPGGAVMKRSRQIITDRTRSRSMGWSTRFVGRSIAIVRRHSHHALSHSRRLDQAEEAATCITWAGKDCCGRPADDRAANHSYARGEIPAHAHADSQRMQMRLTPVLLPRTPTLTRQHAQLQTLHPLRSVHVFSRTNRLSQHFFFFFSKIHQKFTRTSQLPLA